MNRTTRIRIGVLGAAAIARRFVVPAILSLEETFQLAGIASRDISRARKLASEYSCAAYGSYESLLGDMSIDAVYIPLPNGLHYDYVKKALNSGKHVLVEKSLACHGAEVRELVQLAEARNLALIENFQFRFHAQLARILEIVKEGRLGELRCVRCAFGFPPFPDVDNIRYDRTLGGGALLDVGAYPLKLAPYFLGTDLIVVQATSLADPEKGVDLVGGGVLQQRHGPLFCQFAYGFSHQYQCSLDLWGSRGRLCTDRIFTAPPDLAPTLSIQTGNEVEVITVPPDNHFRNMLSHFRNLCLSIEDRATEYQSNLLQASLIEQFQSKALPEFST